MDRRAAIGAEARQDVNTHSDRRQLVTRYRAILVRCTISARLRVDPMKQLVQSVRRGDLRLLDVPAPQIGPTEVLVATGCSLVSAGTERVVRKLASANLVEKARARPDLVRQVLRKARSDGVLPTVRAVRTRLDGEMPLGYSAAGTVLEVGEAVVGIRPGDRVATGGAGHAEVQAVAGLLATRLPEGVSDADAAFATIGAIALHGFRLAEAGPGSRIAVIGLGLVGQLTGRLARAARCEVVGIDVNPWAVERAKGASVDLALVEEGDDTTAAVTGWSRGLGVDAVLVTAATSSSDPIRRAPDLARDRATLVLVGDVGLELDRRPLYEKELSLRVARSYGPGRHERSYEEWGIDYPAGHIRWTEGRNQEAFIGLLARERIVVADLVTHRFAFEEALAAYELLESDTPSLGIELVYRSAVPDRVTPIRLGPRAAGSNGVGLIGAGAFARSVLVPALQSAGLGRLVSVASESGVSAVHLAERVGFEQVVSSAQAVIDDPDVSVVVIATPHESHAALAAAALRARKHVLCEKPLALSEVELDDVEEAWRSSGCHLWVDFNRRYSPAVIEARRHLTTVASPVVITYRVKAGPIDPTHWSADRRQGGRLLGEVCHFVDTCGALAGAPSVEVLAVASPAGEAQAGSDLALALRFGNGSLATITYASGGHRSTAKERVEIIGAGHTLVIDDFRSLTIDGDRAWSGSQDKGHTALVAAFSRALESGTVSRTTEQTLASSRATLAALGSVLHGRAATVEHGTP
jgi:predicted dehydrogenase/threonine dehydrogenase-like Zn-dependent dehydrogenase